MIKFLAPWTLLLAVPVGGIIVLLYLLKLKRKEKKVSSVMLWSAAIADLQANAPLQKLKKNLLLFLQLAVVLLMLIAASRPYRNVSGFGNNRIVAIIDSSASMQSTDVKPSRFEHAKAQLAEIVRSMGPRDTMLIISAGVKPQALASFTSDKRSLARSIRKLKATDVSCDMRQAIVLASSLISEKTSVPARIILLSDGAFGSLEDTPLGTAKVDYRCIGKLSDNAAITSIASRKSVSGTRQVFVGIKNFSQSTKKLNLELYAGDQLIDIREQTLEAGQSSQQILQNGRALSGRITAKLDIKDNLSADNVGYVYLDKPRKLAVLMVSKGNVFLQNAINLDSRTQLEKTDTLPADYYTAGYDITVFDRIKPPDKLPEGGYLLIDTWTKDGPAAEGETIHNPAIVDFDKRHAISRYVDFANIRIASAKVLAPKYWADRIVESAQGPICVAGSRSGRRYVQLSWDILSSDFPLRVGFPIFVANCIDYLGGNKGSNLSFSIRTGQPASIDIPGGVYKLTVKTPEGEVRTVDCQQSPAVFDSTTTAGVYTFTAGSVKGEFAANLASEAESDLTPVRSVKLGERTLTPGTSTVRTNAEFYWPMILATLLILMFEWYAYHRRL